jgi:hypothetical protein
VERYPLRFGRVSGPFLGALGLGTRRSAVTVDGDRLTVAMGWGFRGAAPLSALRSASLVQGRLLERGVHGWRGDWRVAGAGDGLVELRFEPRMKARVLAVPVSVRRLRVSVAEPVALVDRLTGGPSPGRRAAD